MTRAIDKLHMKTTDNVLRFYLPDGHTQYAELSDGDYRKKRSAGTLEKWLKKARKKIRKELV